MTEAELVQYFDYFLQNYQIQTQIMRRDQKLYMMLNRPADVEMDYPFLTEAIVEQLQSLPLDGIQTVILNSRILGQSTPDWKTAVKLSLGYAPAPAPVVSSSPQASAAPASTDLPQGSEPRSRSSARSSSRRTSGHSPQAAGQGSAPPSSITDPQPETHAPAAAKMPESAPEGAVADLSSYCFVRNQLLIKTSLPDPAPEVAEAVQFFHGLSEQQQLEVAPLLVQFFKRPDTYELEELPEDQQAWLSRIQGLNEHKLKSVAVWLSRYCADADKALTQVNATLQVMTPPPPASPSADPTETEADPQVSSEPGAQAPADPTPQGHTGTGATPATQQLPPGSQQHQRPPRSGSQRRSAKPQTPAWQQMALPLVGICLVAALLFGGLWAGLSAGSSYCQKPANPTAQDTTRYDLCQLTSQMMGDDEMSRASLSAERLSAEQLQDLPYQCRREAEDFSDLSFLWGDPTGGNYQVAEVMPGIYTLDLTQTFRGGARDSYRFGCVFRGTVGDNVVLVDRDRLPENWPQTRYSPSVASRMGEGDGEGFSSFGPMVLFSMGGLGIAILGVLFVVNLVITSLSFFAISRAGLGVSIYSLPDLILGSLVFTLLSGLFSFIPSVGWALGFIMDVIQDVFALILAGSVVKGFKTDYTVGFHLLVLCVLILYAIRVLVYWILFLLFGSLVMSMFL